MTVRNFNSYTDYQMALLHAIAQNQAPDVIMAYNHGGYREWDPYVSALGGSLLDFTDFENRFHKLFVDELVFEEKQTVDGQAKVVQGIRGVPF